MLPKLAYLALNLVLFGMAVYKLNSLGVIQTSPYDWIGIYQPATPREFNTNFVV